MKLSYTELSILECMFAVAQENDRLYPDEEDLFRRICIGEVMDLAGKDLLLVRYIFGVVQTTDILYSDEEALLKRIVEETDE